MTAAATADPRRPTTGNDMDTYARDLAELVEHLDLHDLVLVGHSTGGGEVVRYAAQHGVGPRRQGHHRRCRSADHGQVRGQPRGPADRGLRRHPRRRAQGPLAVLHRPRRAVLRRQPRGQHRLRGCQARLLAPGHAGQPRCRLRLRQGVLRDRLHRRPEGPRRADLHRPGRRRPDRARSATPRSSPSSSSRTARSRSTPVRRTASTATTRRSSTRTSSPSSGSRHPAGGSAGRAMSYGQASSAKIHHRKVNCARRCGFDIPRNCGVSRRPERREPSARDADNGAELGSAIRRNHGGRGVPADVLAGDQEDDPPGDRQRHGRRTVRRTGPAVRCRRPARPRAARSGPAARRTAPAAGRPSGRPRPRAAGPDRRRARAARRRPDRRGARRPGPSARSIGRISAGITCAGCRRRAALATWIASAPIRCMSATIQMAETTVRRSEATGASRASSSSATFSALDRISSSRTSEAITCSASDEVGVQQGLGGVPQAVTGDLTHQPAVIAEVGESHLVGLSHGSTIGLRRRPPLRASAVNAG